MADIIRKYAAEMPKTLDSDIEDPEQFAVIADWVESNATSTDISLLVNSGEIVKFITRRAHIRVGTRRIEIMMANRDRIEISRGGLSCSIQ